MDTAARVATIFAIIFGILFVTFLIVSIVYIKKYNSVYTSDEDCAKAKTSLTSGINTCHTSLATCNSDLITCKTPTPTTK